MQMLEQLKNAQAQVAGALNNARNAGLFTYAGAFFTALCALEAAIKQMEPDPAPASPPAPAPDDSAQAEEGTP